MPRCSGAAAGALPGRKQQEKTVGKGRAELKKEDFFSREGWKANRAEGHSWLGMHFKQLFNLRADISIMVSNICLASEMGWGNNLSGCYNAD